jgi:hypothetical protein
MTTPDPNYWFPAKRYGWGWGPPRTWQGWMVLAAFFVLLLVGAVSILPRLGAAWFVAYSFALCLGLMAICWVKGERPSWRWGRSAPRKNDAGS